MKRLLTFSAISFTLLLSSLFPFSAHAADPVNVQEEFAKTLNSAGLISGATAGDITNPYDVINQIIFSILSITGTVILVLVIYGGVLWATARGNDDQLKQAQQTIVRGVIGLVIVFSAYVISNFVLSALGSAATGSSIPQPSIQEGVDVFDQTPGLAPGQGVG